MARKTKCRVCVAIVKSDIPSEELEEQLCLSNRTRVPPDPGAKNI